MQKLLHFIKYNNATVIILAIVLILGGGALAAGPENIGQKQTRVEGLDNTVLLAVDLEAFNMDFKIENVQQDEKYYYVTYSFLDLALSNNAWQYQLSQKTQKVSKKIKQDIGLYMAKFMAKHYEARTRELKNEKSLARSAGEQKRVEVTEYSGLIGRTLDLAAAVFPGYEPVVKIELPTPEFIILPTPFIKGAENSGTADNLTQIYNDYIAAHPEIFMDSADSPQAAPVNPPTPLSEGGQNTASGTTEVLVPETPLDTVVPETPGIPEPISVDIIELPPLTPVENIVPAEPAPVAESAPAPVESAPAETPAPEPAAPAEPAP